MAEGRGLVLVLAGDGRPWVTGGVVLRALGQGLDVLVCPLDGDGQVYRQLVRTTGLPGRLAVCPCPGDPERWLTTMAGEIAAGRHDMIVLPAVERILAEGLERELVSLLDARPPGLHLVLAGQGDLGGLADAADMVTCFERRK
ncbi:MAG TPA: hypothetical protein VMW83_14390 [Spirochaetia bacterium]|nr:hypothetical protein [Spirochaetia bacterium]